jgi:hypothetical protein
MIILDQLSGDHLARGWSLVAPWLQAALDHGGGDFTLNEIMAAVAERRVAIWAIYDSDNPLPLLGAAASGVRHDGRINVATIHAIAGRDMRAWLDTALSEFENLAAEHGIDRIEFIGRAGWARQLPDYFIHGDADKGYVRMAKAITVH